MKTMLSMMDSLRSDAPKALGGKCIARVEDYKTGVALDVATGEKSTLSYPSSNVIIFVIENKDKVIIRPSGTEPKVKFYYTAVGENKEAAKALLDAMVQQMSV